MIHCNTLSELSGQEVYEIFMLRQQVFIIEQNCLYQDIDSTDMDSLHLRDLDEKGQLMGYLRIIPPGSDNDANESLAIGRVAVKKKFRRRGVAQELMNSAIETCISKYPNKKIRLAAQTYLIDFYSSFGFAQIGASYIEDDIPHQDMVLQL